MAQRVGGRVNVCCGAAMGLSTKASTNRCSTPYSICAWRILYRREEAGRLLATAWVLVERGQRRARQGNNPSRGAQRKEARGLDNKVKIRAIGVRDSSVGQSPVAEYFVRHQHTARP